VPRLHTTAAALAAAAACLSAGAPAEAATYRNPVARGDYPDPSAIRIRGGYLAAATGTPSSGAVPPLLRSPDLVHWRRFGRMFRRFPRWVRGDIWAPELTWSSGRVVVYYSARSRRGRHCVAAATSRRPFGRYVDRRRLVCQRTGSIDPFVAAAPDGRYLVWKNDGNGYRRGAHIWIQRLRPDGLGVVGPRVSILDGRPGWERGIIEAPAIVHHDGLYYLFYSGGACCEPGCTYAVGVARSANLVSGWERFRGNPIMRANGKWLCPGHGSPIDDRAGTLYLLYHAYRRGRAARGRALLLDRIDWRQAWPEINRGRGPGIASHPNPAGAPTAR
jgi:xylan 1,4-beta-xylosidase